MNQDKSMPTFIHCSAPALQEHFISRPEIMRQLKNHLLTDLPSTSTSLPISVLHGPGGIGKSTLAIALAHDPQVQSRFPDGIYWASLGQDPDLLSLLSAWIRELGDYDYKPTILQDATTHLHNLLEEKAALLIVDDAWNDAQARAFCVGGVQCQVLITTRIAEVAQRLGAGFSLDTFTQEEAQALFAAHLGRSIEKYDPQQALQFAPLVGYLPLALELAAGRISRGISWETLINDLNREVDRLEKSDTVSLRGRAESRLEACFNITLNALRRDAPATWKAFVWLGVLPEDVLITAPMAANLWQTDEPTADKTLERLRNYALLRGELVQSGAYSSYRLHDILHDTARQLLTTPEPIGLGCTLVQAHQTVLDHYESRCQSTEKRDTLWHTIPDDGYSHAHLTWHMLKAEHPEAIENLLSEETPDGRNAWYKACEKLGKTATFLLDVSRAAQLVAERNRERIASRLPADGLVEELRYALIQASISSLATSIPIELIKMLITDGIWSLAQGLTFIERASEGSVDTFCQLLPFLTDVERQIVLNKAWDRVRATSEEFRRACMLQDIVKALKEPGELIKAFEIVLEIANSISDDSDRAYALTESAVSFAQFGAVGEALEIVNAIPRDYKQVEALCRLTYLLPDAKREAMVRRALEAANAICWDSSRAWGLIRVAYLMTDSEREATLNQALEITESISTAPIRADLLIKIAKQKKGTERQNIRNKVIEIANTISEEPAKANLLMEVWNLKEPGPIEMKVEVSPTLSEAAALIQSSATLHEAWERANALPNTRIRFEALSMIASSFAKSGDTNTALEIASAIRHNTFRASALGDIVIAFAEAGDPNRALEVISSVYEDLDSSVLSAVASALVGMEDRKQALEMIRAYEDHRHQREIRSQMVFAFAQAGDLGQAVEVSWSRDTDLPSSDILENLASVFVKAGDIGKALEVAAVIPWPHYRSNALTEIAHALIQSGDILHALRVAYTIPEDDQRARMLIEIASRQTRAERQETLSKALEAAHTIADEHYSNETLFAVASLLAQRGDHNRALETINAMSHNVDQYQTVSKNAALDKIARVFAKAGDHDRAEQAINAISSEEYRPAIWAEIAAEIVVTQAQTGDFDNALETAHTIPWEYREAALLKIASYQTTSERLPLLNDALAIASTIADKRHRTNVLQDIASAFVQSGDVQKATEIIQAIPDADAQAYGFQHIAFLLAGSEQKTALNRAWEIASSITEEPNRSYSLSQLAESFAKAGDLHRALEIAKAILADDSSQVGALTKIASYAIGSEQIALLDEALERVKASVDAKSRNWDIADVASAYARAGYIEKALDIVSAIPEEDDRSNALGWVVLEIPCSEVQRMLNRILGIANSVSDYNRRAETLPEITFAIAQIGDVDTALEVANAIPEEWVRAYALAAMVTALTEAGDINRALETACTITSERDLSGALSEIASAIAPTNKTANISDPSDSTEESHIHFPFLRLGYRRRFDNPTRNQTPLQIVPEEIPSVVQRILTAAATILDSKGRMNVYHALRSAMTPELIYQFWRAILPYLAEQNRYVIFNDLPRLIELTACLQEDNFLPEAADTLRQVIRWWP